MSEDGTVGYGDARIAYAVARSTRRIKTVEITVEGLDRIVVAAPEFVSIRRIEAIVRRRARWILRHQFIAARALEQLPLANGGSLPYLGRSVRVWVHQGTEPRPALRFHHWQFELTSAVGHEIRSASIVRAIESWYRKHALAYLKGRIGVLAPRLGVQPSGILVRDQRTRWGSCSPQGVLRFNWRIIMTPPSLIDYVVVHELAHLRVRTHGPEYWAEVARVIPDHRDRRRRLRELGPHLPL